MCYCFFCNVKELCVLYLVYLVLPSVWWSIVEGDSKPHNLMHDRRVVRGNTYSTVVVTQVANSTQVSTTHLKFALTAFHIHVEILSFNCETQPPASIGWVALSSLFVRCLSRIGNISSHLHYMMFWTTQTIYFLWGYDPGNMSVSYSKLPSIWVSHSCTKSS